MSANASVALDLRRLPVLARQQIDHAELPQRYKAARRALQECARIDELKDISDKHSAIAHYAKQAKDKTLMFYAERIKLRAFERIGELLAELPTHKERMSTASQHGVAGRTASHAYEAAQIPKRVREKLIEATPPPTMTELAEYGKRYMPKTYVARGAGFHNHQLREESIRRTPLSAAFELGDFLGSVSVDIDELLSDRCGGRFSMAQLARALKGDGGANGSSTAGPEWHYIDKLRDCAISIIDKLDDLERHLPKHESSADTGRTE